MSSFVNILPIYKQSLQEKIGTIKIALPQTPDNPLSPQDSTKGVFQRKISISHHGKANER